MTTSTMTRPAVSLLLGLALVLVPARSDAICTPEQGGTPCTKNGCPGTNECLGGRIQCVADTSARVACTECGQGGTRACGGGPCQPSTPGPEVCDLCDNNANGQVDENLSQACGLGNGCGGTQTCQSGSWSACGCGGVQQTVACGQSACGTTKTMTCDASCQPVTVCIAEEVCNGCDDDGSGVADDYVTCSGQCR